MSSKDFHLEDHNKEEGERDSSEDSTTEMIDRV